MGTCRMPRENPSGSRTKRNNGKYQLRIIVNGEQRALKLAPV